MDPSTCRGCLRCELACSFHHSGHRFFQPSLSSTRIFRSNVDKTVRMVIDDTCDGCATEPDALPLCVRACVFGARGVSRREAA